jgi:hypothetical protein
VNDHNWENAGVEIDGIFHYNDGNLIDYGTSLINSYQISCVIHIGVISRTVPNFRRQAMDLSVLADLFSQRIFLHLSPAIYATNLIARVIYMVFKRVDFNTDRFRQIWGQAGRRLQETVITQMAIQAQKGVDALTEWLENNLNKTEVNETAAQVVVNEAESIGKTFDEATETRDEQRTAVVQRVNQGFQELGGITATIAEQFALALQNPDQRQAIARHLNELIQTQVEQSQIARRSSEIKDSSQRAEGRVQGKQIQEATDNSKITGSSQTIIGPKDKPDSDVG